MDDAKAAEILKSLAAGVDPAAGTRLVDLAPLQSPDVVRALFQAADSLESRMRQARRQTALIVFLGSSSPFRSPVNSRPSGAVPNCRTCS